MNAALVPLTFEDAAPHIGPRGGLTVRPPQKFNYWYAAIVDLMLAEPELKQGEIAQRLGRTQAWISTIMSTDMFKAYHDLRRRAFNEALQERISGKLSQVTEAALDSLLSGIKAKGEAMPVTERAEIVDNLLGKLGYGSKHTPAVVVNNNTNVTTQVTTSVSREVLQEARASLRALEELKLAKAQGLVIDLSPVAEAPKPALSPSLASLMVE